MTEEATDAPNTVADQSWSAIRSLIMALSAYASGRGWIANDTATMILAVAGIVIPFAIGQMKTRRRALALHAATVKP